ncbi:tetratricopeptide repeat protein [Flagellimonas nanhaiensis]|uniref:Uncharacterized protein n=1 Tax=Flagellimonas nanhaiensis TaxID=2292706 RepID=A0A371JMR5_9FLAO|nr:tetratricopeptide repeat protein [Allomuricauda nanhaiensis]RDY58428.1 hypothetical protein DX873_15620 [Allomuricauda nanhaiensis]
MNPIVRTVLGLLFVCTVYGQDSMENGFQLLEKGDFSKAEIYFQTYLENHPDNRTAQICYGRAVGLNGRPDIANQHFGKLIGKLPNDFEVRINYYESFLWSKKYEEAELLYEELVENHPEEFSAVLGYANSLSNVEKYEEALIWIDRALSLKPNNKSALISKKYIKLGLSHKLAMAQKYNNALQVLHLNLNNFPQDRETLLGLANIHLMTKNVDKAKAAYQKMAVTRVDSIVALNGIALAEHIGKKEKAALAFALSSKEKLKPNDDAELQEKTLERYAQALIWNHKYVKARSFIDNLSIQYPNRNWVLALKATLGMYTGNIKYSLAQYDAILVSDSTSFDGNLGKANAHFALGHIKKAYLAAQKTLELYENQKDAQSLIEKIKSSHSPFVEELVAYSFDNGNNIAYTSNTKAEFPLSAKLKSTVNYQYRRTENSVSNNKASLHAVSAGLTYSLRPKLKLHAGLGLNRAQFMDNGYTQPILNLKMITEPYRLQNLEIGYQREVQNFNSDLIEREIVMEHYGLNYNIETNFGLGWYTQLMHTQQSDENQRDLLFTSLYYTVLRKPNLKLGVNYQYIAFSEQVPTIYFSPENYQAGEFFAEIGGNFSYKTSYRLNAASGLQKVEENPKTAIFRMEAQIKHQFSKRFGGGLYGKYSNISSAVATGFEFTEVGLQVKWLLTNKPIFQGQLASK